MSRVWLVLRCCCNWALFKSGDCGVTCQYLLHSDSTAYAHCRGLIVFKTPYVHLCRTRTRYCPTDSKQAPSSPSPRSNVIQSSDLYGTISWHLHSASVHRFKEAFRVWRNTLIPTVFFGSFYNAFLVLSVSRLTDNNNNNNIRVVSRRSLEALTARIFSHARMFLSTVRSVTCSFRDSLMIRRPKMPSCCGVSEWSTDTSRSAFATFPRRGATAKHSLPFFTGTGNWHLAPNCLFCLSTVENEVTNLFLSVNVVSCHYCKH